MIEVYRISRVDLKTGEPTMTNIPSFEVASKAELKERKKTMERVHMAKFDFHFIDKTKKHKQ